MPCKIFHFGNQPVAVKLKNNRRKRGKEGQKRGEELAETIFESLRPAQDIHPEPEKGTRVEDKEPEKVFWKAEPMRQKSIYEKQ